MDKQPLISIVVAVFNGADTIQRCIDSIAAQTFEGWELIVVDGGSSDGTPEILCANERHLSYWQSKPDRGIYHAWNQALEKARGKWILFLGADDRLHDSMVLADFAAHLESEAQAMVYGKLRFEGGRLDRLVIGEPWSWRKFRRRMTIPHPAAFHHRSLFARLGYFSEEYPIAGDYEFLLRAKDRLSPRFIDRMVTTMSAEGASSTKVFQSLAEAKKAQLKHRVSPRLLVGCWYLYAVVRTRLAKS